MVGRFELAMQRDHDDLAARCRAGDMDALRQVYEQYQQDVFGLAYRLLNHREEAADVRQETFINAFRSFARFRVDSSLKTWLFTICANLCRARIASSKRRREVSFDSEVVEEWIQEDGGQDPFQAVVRSENARIVRIALGSLPVAERELIVLREYEELEYEEIARIAGCSAATVGVKLFRARRRLRERIESILDSERANHV